MRTPSFNSKHFLAVGTIALAVTVAVPGSASAKSAGCAGAGSVTQNSAQLTKTIRCLHNRIRHAHGLRSLRSKHQLSKAAAGHANDMVRRTYFAHRSPSGTDHMDRLKAVGYGESAPCWSAGENLLSSPVRLSPRQIMKAWMGSPAHRANILQKPWREFGLGIVMTSPTGKAGGMTIVALFGTRSMAC